MSWDCSYHLVDPAEISKAMDSLARGQAAPTQLAKVYGEEGLSLWREAQQRVLEEEPERACQLACQLAIYLASCSFPHHAERNVALSFAQSDSERTQGPWLPEQYKASPELMMKALLKKRPELSGHFHEAFHTNSDTGVFIPADKATDAAHAVYPELRRHPQYEGLYKVLLAAARYQLAYWEATDLAVKQSQPKMLTPPYAHFEWLQELSELPEDPELSVRLSSGERLRCVTEQGTMTPIQVQLVSADGRIVKRFSAPLPNHLVKMAACGSSAIVAPRDVFSLKGKSLPVCYFDGESLQAIDGLPAPQAGKLYGQQWHPIGVATLSSGSAVITWNGQGYEIREGKLVGAAWKLGVAPKDASDSLLPWSTDGFYYIDGKRLRRIRRGEAPEVVAQFPDLLRSIHPGPRVDGEDTLLLCHRPKDPSTRSLRGASLFFPDSRVESPFLLLDLKGANELVYADGHFWGRTQKAALQFERVPFRIAASHLLSLPRFKVKVPKR